MISFRKEKIKTLSIVVLFSITILLLYFLWEDSTSKEESFQFNAASIEDTNSQIMDIEKFLEPFRLRINFGGSKYTVLYTGFDDIWDQLVTAYCDSTQYELYIEDISLLQWNQILDYESVKFDFGSGIPYGSLRETIGANKTQTDEIIEVFTAIAYSRASPESFFIYDGKNNKYYRIVSEKIYENILEPLSEIENRDFFDKYYPINTFFGVENNNLMPHSLKNSIQEITGEQEIQYFEDEKINALAATFFGESFDFVRKIVETNGTVVYMYGYGKKMLVVDTKGFLEYREEVDNVHYGTVSYLNSFSVAIDFVTNHGNWKTLKGTNIYPYLKESLSIEKNNKRGFRFTFGYRINGYPVSYQGNSKALVVEVLGNQVTYYSRYILNQKDTHQYMTNSEQELESNMASTMNILTNSYPYIKEAYVQDGYDFGEKINDEIFNEIVGFIRMVDVGYFLPEENQKDEEIQLIPSWIFKTDKYLFFFDARTGDPIGWHPLR